MYGNILCTTTVSIYDIPTVCWFKNRKANQKKKSRVFQKKLGFPKKAVFFKKKLGFQKKLGFLKQSWVFKEKMGFTEKLRFKCKSIGFSKEKKMTSNKTLGVWMSLMGHRRFPT